MRREVSCWSGWVGLAKFGKYFGAPRNPSESVVVDVQPVPVAEGVVQLGDEAVGIVGLGGIHEIVVLEKRANIGIGRRV